MSISKKTESRIYKRDEGFCGMHLNICGFKRKVNKKDASYDHVIPRVILRNYNITGERLKKLGRVIGQSYFHLQLMHKSCNSRRSGIITINMMENSYCQCCDFVYSLNLDKDILTLNWIIRGTIGVGEISLKIDDFEVFSPQGLATSMGMLFGRPKETRNRVWGGNIGGKIKLKRMIKELMNKEPDRFRIVEKKDMGKFAEYSIKHRGKSILFGMEWKYTPIVRVCIGETEIWHS